MAKKCIPGVFCIENMTLFALIGLTAFLAFIYYLSVVKSAVIQSTPRFSSPHQQFLLPPAPIPPRNRCENQMCMNLQMQNTRDIFNDPYIPPVKRDDCIYRQIGILTESTVHEMLTSTNQTLILPLMGKQHMNGRDKWNYYTISNTGALNTKLPIRIKGRACSFEYGCDQLFSGDVVVVEGYNQSFQVTVYENNAFSYAPVF